MTYFPTNKPLIDFSALLATTNKLGIQAVLPPDFIRDRISTSTLATPGIQVPTNRPDQLAVNPDNIDLIRDRIARGTLPKEDLDLYEPPEFEDCPAPSDQHKTEQHQKSFSDPLVVAKLTAAFAEHNMVCVVRNRTNGAGKTKAYFMTADYSSFGLTSFRLFNATMGGQPDNVKETLLMEFEQSLNDRSDTKNEECRQKVSAIVKSCGYCPVVSFNGSCFTVVPFNLPENI